MKINIWKKNAKLILMFDCLNITYTKIVTLKCLHKVYLYD